MTHQKVSGGYIVVLKKDEKLVESIKQFIKTHKITGAWLSGLGGAQGVTLGFYHLDKKEYEFQNITKLLEITNLTGNISFHGDEAVIHLHGTFSDEKLHAFGGHVSELVVGGTCELHITPIKGSLKRTHDEDTGLNLLDCQ